MSSTQFHRHIDAEGRISFKIGDQTLDPTNREEQIAVAHLLRTYDHLTNTHIAGDQWVQWLGVDSSDTERHRRLIRAWGMLAREDDITTVAKMIRPILEEVLAEPGLVVEQTGDPDLLVVRIEHNPRQVRLYLKRGELDCTKYDDWMAGAAALRSPDRRPPAINSDEIAYRLWVEWSEQSPFERHTPDLKKVWDSFPAERFADAPDIPEPVQSSRSRVGQVLNRFTQSAGNVVGYSFDLYSSESVSEDTISGQTLVVRNLPELQQQLADLVETLITERIGQQQVLKARGATVLDCHQLGLLSDDDMANHMADCLMVLLGKPVGAKAAKSIMLAAVDYATAADWSINGKSLDANRVYQYLERNSQACKRTSLDNVEDVLAAIRVMGDDK
jgi:hypothetical protein